MAITQNTYTGNGSTVLFSFTFPYLETTDIKVSLNGVTTTAYSLANATTVQLATAPANGVAIRIYRQTDDSSTEATFYPGSAIRSQDLNDNFTQGLYLAQESNKTAADALDVVDDALGIANTAQTNSLQAVATANASNVSSAQAVATANSAVSIANAAVSTANASNSTSASAVTTANLADQKADAAIAAVASSVNYTAYANVAAIPASPSNNTYIEVLNSTGLESFTPLSGKPVGFVGDSGLTVRLRYTTAGNTWVWINYYPNDSDGRYLKKVGGTMTGALTLSGAPSSNLHAATKQYVDAVEVQAVSAQSTANTAVSNAATAQSTANTAVTNAATSQSTANAALPKAGGTMTGNITFNAGQTFPNSGITAASTSVAGIVQLTDSTSSTSTTTAATPASVKSTYDFALVVSSTANAAMPKAGGTFTGDVTFNTTTATTLPVGTTAQRPTGTTGMVRYNSSLGGFEGFSGADWGSLGGGATGGANDKVFVLTDQTITTSYQLSAGKNAMTAGPVTVASGATVTIPSGAAWVIV
jgi:hypothetical protein